MKVRSIVSAVNFDKGDLSSVKNEGFQRLKLFQTRNVSLMLDPSSNVVT